MGSKIIQRLELALRVKKPTPGEVLEQVSTRGVLRGPVDFVFSAWRLYVEYAAQVIAETFQLTEEERRTLLNFRDAVKTLLTEAQRQARRSWRRCIRPSPRARTGWRAANCSHRTGRGCTQERTSFHAF
jgi:hypothetical protein